MSNLAVEGKKSSQMYFNETNLKSFDNFLKKKCLPHHLDQHCHKSYLYWPPGVGKYWFIAFGSKASCFCLFCLEHQLLSLHTNNCPSATCLCYVHLFFFTQRWANFLTTDISAIAWGRATTTVPQWTQPRSRPYNTERAPGVCDNRVFDGNAGPFGPPKPGVSTSARCLINNWQRQTNQNNLVPTAKCWSSLTPVNH